MTAAVLPSKVLAIRYLFTAGLPADNRLAEWLVFQMKLVVANAVRWLLFTSVLSALAGSASAQSDYQVISVSHGATITGSVKWSGPMPHLANFPITKDPQICDPDSHKTRDLERLIVGSQGGVANTVVFIKDISSGKAFDLPPPGVFWTSTCAGMSRTFCWCRSGLLCR